MLFRSQPYGSALTPPVSSASAARAMIGAVLAPVLDSGLDTPFGCVDGLRGLVGVSRGNLQTSRVELLASVGHADGFSVPYSHVFDQSDRSMPELPDANFTNSAVVTVCS